MTLREPPPAPIGVRTAPDAGGRPVMFDAANPASRVAIVATASVLPETVVTNEEIGEMLLANLDPDAKGADEAAATVRKRAKLIEAKTGLRSRRFFADDDMPAGVGTELLHRLMAGRDDWSDLDAIIVASSSIQGFPGISQQVLANVREAHPELGNPFVLDINSNACTNFLYALTVASGLMKGMGYRRVAVLALEFSSRCIAYDPAEFGTSTLFGDAASGILLADKGGEGETVIAMIEGLRASSRIDRDHIDMISGASIQASSPETPVPETMRWYMAGPPVAIGAGDILVKEIRAYQAEGVAIDWLIPHQANLTRILIPACKTAGIDQSRLCHSFAETGNTSSASVPLILDRLAREKKFAAGETALLIAFGASFSIGSALLRFV